MRKEMLRRIVLFIPPPRSTLIDIWMLWQGNVGGTVWFTPLITWWYNQVSDGTVETQAQRLWQNSALGRYKWPCQYLNNWGDTWVIQTINRWSTTALPQWASYSPCTMSQERQWPSTRQHRKAEPNIRTNMYRPGLHVHK